MEKRKALGTVVAVLVTLAKHKATYRFLAVVLVAVGVTHGEEVALAIQTVACAYLGCIG